MLEQAISLIHEVAMKLILSVSDEAWRKIEQSNHKPIV
jgi:hypothetical protein